MRASSSRTPVRCTWRTRCRSGGRVAARARWEGMRGRSRRIAWGNPRSESAMVFAPTCSRIKAGCLYFRSCGAASGRASSSRLPVWTLMKHLGWIDFLSSGSGRRQCWQWECEWTLAKLAKRYLMLIPLSRQYTSIIVPRPHRPSYMVLAHSFCCDK